MDYTTINTRTKKYANIEGKQGIMFKKVTRSNYYDIIENQLNGCDTFILKMHSWKVQWTVNRMLFERGYKRVFSLKELD